MKNPVKRFVFCAVIAAVFLFSGINWGGASEMPYGISHSTLLNGVGIFPENGILKLDNIQAVFLPRQEIKGWIILKKDGRDINRFDFYSEPLKGPYSLLQLTTNRDLVNGQVNPVPGRCQIKEPGKYSLDFHTKQGLFYTFPFEISRTSSADPFGSSPHSWFVEGEWDRFGYFYYADADPNRPLIWKIWLRDKSASRRTDTKVDLKVIRDADGKAVAANRENMTYSLEKQWRRYEFDLTVPGTGGSMIYAKDLLPKNGGYTLKMALNGKPYGEWKFTLEGGRFKPAGRTVRGSDPKIFVEGGKDAFWYEKR